MSLTICMTVVKLLKICMTWWISKTIFIVLTMLLELANPEDSQTDLRVACKGPQLWFIFIFIEKSNLEMNIEHELWQRKRQRLMMICFQILTKINDIFFFSYVFLCFLYQWTMLHILMFPITVKIKPIIIIILYYYLLTWPVITISAIYPTLLGSMDGQRKLGILIIKIHKSMHFFAIIIYNNNRFYFHSDRKHKNM